MRNTDHNQDISTSGSFVSFQVVVGVTRLRMTRPRLAAGEQEASFAASVAEPPTGWRPAFLVHSPSLCLGFTAIKTGEDLVGDLTYDLFGPDRATVASYL